MLALTCLLLFAVAAGASVSTMIVAVQRNGDNVVKLRMSYVSTPRELSISWRSAPSWEELKGETPTVVRDWPVAPQKLAA